jgi:excinuclease UvrABC nuclease subunit
MLARAPETLAVSGDLSLLDRAIETLPDRPAIFLIRPREGAAPYLARTNLLRRRLRRLLKDRPQPSKLLNLRGVAERIEYWLTGSQLEASLLIYDLARRHFPDSYLKILKLRMPPYVKIILGNPFPRSHITTRLTNSPAVFYGPFRNRSLADQFHGELLGLFQMRRCEADLTPSPDFPGCIYGEMNMCLRPCQQAVTGEEYASEIHRVTEFLSTDGKSLLGTVAAARDRFSAELDFEAAAQQHKRLEKIQQALKLRDELARDIAGLDGVAVTRSVAPNSVELWFVLQGCWQASRRLSFEVVEGKPAPLDHKLREIVADLAREAFPPRLAAHERQERLALLARWFYSSWREGEWLGFDGLDSVPYRKLVRAISRVAAESHAG